MTLQLNVSYINSIGSNEIRIRQKQNLIDLKNPEKNYFLKWNKETCDEITAFLNIMETVINLREKIELKFNFKEILLKKTNLLIQSKKIFYKSISKFNQ